MRHGCFLILVIFSILSTTHATKPSPISITDTADHDVIVQKSLEQFFSTDENNYTCSICPEGTFSNAELSPQLNCSDYCAPGECPIPIVNCTLCSPGTYNNFTNQTACETCPTGQISPEEGAAECVVCLPGESNNDDHTACDPCPAGTANPDAGGTCINCEPGEYANDQRSISCKTCSAGTYNPYPGQSTCSLCGTGKYNPESGSTSKDACLPCPDGYYCPYDFTQTPIQCPKNTYCKQGSKEPTDCASLMGSSSGSKSCHPTTEFYLLILACVLGVIFVLMIIVLVKQKSRKHQYHTLSTPVKNFKEHDKLIPPPKDGPVYTGL